MDTEVCKMWGSYARGPVNSPFGQLKKWKLFLQHQRSNSVSQQDVLEKKKREKNQKIEGIFSPCNKKEQLSILKPIDAGLDGL